MPSNGGSECEGPAAITTLCAVNGGWTSWTESGNCDTDFGQMSRSRNCTNPTPKNGGANCTGESEDHHICQVDGAWATWTLVADTCDDKTGLQNRLSLIHI